MLEEWAKCKKLIFIFLIETLCNRNTLERLKSKLGYEGLFVVEPLGRSGGIALFWKASSKVRLIKFSRNFIDVEVEYQELGKWRMTGFYGFPESSRRRDSWNLLRTLSDVSSLPWVCIGDFNDLLAANEKRGKHKHPNWKLQGFKQAVSDSGLLDIGMEGYQFTWERSRGTDNWVEERLDRVLATDLWISRFKEAQVWSLESSTSDHLPIFIDPKPLAHSRRLKRFRFENMWLREANCAEVVRSS